MSEDKVTAVREPNFGDYLKAAFHFSIPVPGLGGLPLNYLFLGLTAGATIAYWPFLLFGSAAKGAFDPASSDLDFLVEFDQPIGMNAFHQFIDLKLDLEDLFGRHVDLLTWRAVKDPFFRQRAEETAVELYAA